MLNSLDITLKRYSLPQDPDLPKLIPGERHLLKFRILSTEHHHITIFIKPLQGRFVSDRDGSDLTIFHFRLLADKDIIPVIDTSTDHRIPMDLQNIISLDINSSIYIECHSVRHESGFSSSDPIEEREGLPRNRGDVGEGGESHGRP